MVAHLLGRLEDRVNELDRAHEVPVVEVFDRVAVALPAVELDPASALDL